MRTFIKILSSFVLCVALSFCSSSCEQNKSQSQGNYPYKDIKPPKDIDFNLAELSEDLEALESIMEAERTFIVTYSADLDYNNHVGNEWGYGVEYDGEYIESGSHIVNSGILGGVEFRAYATEFDSENDYGSTLVSFKALEVGEKQTKNVTVIVRENNGRYSGNTAQWIFNITVKRIA